MGEVFMRFVILGYLSLERFDQLQLRRVVMCWFKNRLMGMGLGILMPYPNVSYGWISMASLASRCVGGDVKISGVGITVPMGAIQ
ncbi:hypothetical protein G4B88_016324 [Cannabis sativa]|uniref:Uncharacterized protein n=1 Tax=Cannabis sativa TaxID=3483 RepID=A0A7J6GLY2_CANSA|nr:hypothetical protein G4B88_016324 [Cannabis sativa]